MVKGHARWAERQARQLPRFMFCQEVWIKPLIEIQKPFVWFSCFWVDNSRPPAEAKCHQFLDDFIEAVKAGKHPLIAADAHYAFFAYSIGAFLSQILVISNYNGYFDNTKLCMFCGGPVFNRFSPVTKFILDSEANVVLYSFLIEHLESHLKKDARLNHYLNGDHTEGIVFRAMLDYKVNSELRENAFRKLSKQIMAIGLKQDTVIPPYEIINTLQGKYRDIPVRVDILDFPYRYKHEDPFPALEKLRNQTDEVFGKVFDSICEFLKA